MMHGHMQFIEFFSHVARHSTIANIGIDLAFGCNPNAMGSKPSCKWTLLAG
jgi:hypothetical protein